MSNRYLTKRRDGPYGWSSSKLKKRSLSQSSLLSGDSSDLIGKTERVYENAFSTKQMGGSVLNSGLVRPSIPNAYITAERMDKLYSTEHAESLPQTIIYFY